MVLICQRVLPFWDVSSHLHVKVLHGIQAQAPQTSVGMAAAAVDPDHGTAMEDPVRLFRCPDLPVEQPGGSVPKGQGLV